MVTATFPCFQDEVMLEGTKGTFVRKSLVLPDPNSYTEVCFWKRAQILVAETWAAFYPPPLLKQKHPIFHGPHGPKIHQLTMFADYRVPQILHHLQILSYPPSLLRLLRGASPIAPGSVEEISIRSASIVAVERLREVMLKLRREDESLDQFSSVVIDFYLWDLAKKVEESQERLSMFQLVPIHRTRSVWY